MGLPRKTTLSRNTIIKKPRYMFTCVICNEDKILSEILSHTKLCHESVLNNLLLEFDSEITDLKKKYDNKLSTIKKCIHMDELCKNCKYFSKCITTDTDINDIL